MYPGLAASVTVKLPRTVVFGAPVSTVTVPPAGIRLSTTRGAEGTPGGYSGLRSLSHETA